MNRSLSMAKFDDARTSQSEERSHRNEKDLERWAAELAGLLQAPTAPKAISAAEAKSELPAPEVWQRGVGAVTLGESQQAGAPLRNDQLPDTSTHAAMEQQVQVRVKTEEFGEVAVVIERLQTGLRVLIGAEDAHAAGSLQRQSQSVRQALEREGENVQVVEVVRMQGNGTRFASTAIATNRRLPQAKDADAGPSEPGQRKRRAKRVNLSG